MKIQKFVIGYVLALALLLFAQQRPATSSQPAGFREVVDLTHSLPANGLETPRKSGLSPGNSCPFREDVRCRSLLATICHPN